MSKYLKSLVGGGIAVFVAGAIVAQTPALTRTMVTKADVSVPGREAVVARVEIAPAGVAGWHTHPGDEISYIMEGEATVMMAGQPPRKVAAGEGFVIPAGTSCTTPRTTVRPRSSSSVVYVVRRRANPSHRRLPLLRSSAATPRSRLNCPQAQREDLCQAQPAETGALPDRREVGRGIEKQLGDQRLGGSRRWIAEMT